MRLKTIALAAVSLFTATAPKPQAQTAPAKIAGAWQISMQGQSAAVSQTLMIEQNFGNITGTIKAKEGPAVPISGTVKGKIVAFTVKRPTPVGEVVQEFAGTVSGDFITGTVSQGQFRVNWAGVKEHRAQ